MELERKTFNAFLNYLREHGYPESSLAIEHRIGKYRADLVILDPTLGLPLAIFEIKSRPSDMDIKLGTKQLKTYLKEIPDKAIPTYLVFPSHQPPFFQVHRVSVEPTEKDVLDDPIDPSTQLNYSILRTTRLSEKNED